MKLRYLAWAMWILPGVREFLHSTGKTKILTLNFVRLKDGTFICSIIQYVFDLRFSSEWRPVALCGAGLQTRTLDGRRRRWWQSPCPRQSPFSCNHRKSTFLWWYEQHMHDWALYRQVESRVLWVVWHLTDVVSSLLEVALLKGITWSVWTRPKHSRAACVCWLWTADRWTWSRCSRGLWETTVTYRLTCVASSTGQTQTHHLFDEIYPGSVTHYFCIQERCVWYILIYVFKFGGVGMQEKGKKGFVVCLFLSTLQISPWNKRFPLKNNPVIVLFAKQLPVSELKCGFAFFVSSKCDLLWRSTVLYGLLERIH